MTGFYFLIRGKTFVVYRAVPDTIEKFVRRFGFQSQTRVGIPLISDDFIVYLLLNICNYFVIQLKQTYPEHFLPE